MKEVEIESEFNANVLTINGFHLELETKSSVKSRTGIYLSNDITNTRKLDLEGSNSHLVIVDIEGNSDV